MTDLDLRGYYDASYPPSLWNGGGGGGGGGGTVVVEVMPGSMSAVATVTGGTPNVHYRYDWGDGQAGDITLDDQGGGQISHIYQTPGTFHAVARNEADVIIAETDITVPGPDEPQEPEPEPVPPTGVVAGTPGAFAPAGADVPATIADLRALGIGAGPAWTEGEYVVIGSGNVHWDGADWQMGTAPPPEPEQEPA